MLDLYADGGVIGQNPSEVGGTWAWCTVYSDLVVSQGSGSVTPEEIGLPKVTNNFTELFAAVSGMSAMPDDWDGTIYTDSQTTMYRIRLGARKKPAMKGIPDWLQEDLHIEQRRLGRYRVVMLSGHPSAVELASGWRSSLPGKHGIRVSKHNVFCDELCNREAMWFLSAKKE